MMPRTTTTWVFLTCALITTFAEARKPDPTPTPVPPKPGTSRKLGGGIVAPSVASDSSPRPSSTPSAAGLAGSSIADAARRSREAKEQKKPSLGVITNDTLRRPSAPAGTAGTATSSRGTLTVAPGRPGESQPAPAPTFAPVTDLNGRTEEEWRAKVTAVREKVGASEAEVKRLEEETRRLENDFFAWSDGNYRDGVIKPAWDRAKAGLKTARESLDTANQSQADLEEEARKAGVPPGWLR